MPDAPRQSEDHAAEMELVPPRGPIPPSFFEAHRSHIAIGLALALFAVLLWMLLRRKPVPPAPPPPATIARGELERLRSAGAGSRDPAVVPAVARVVRVFLLRQLGLPIEELTTGEMADALRRERVVPRDAADAAIGFLRRCDVLKFAPDAAPVSMDLVSEASRVVDRFEFISCGEKPSGDADAAAVRP